MDLIHEIDKLDDQAKRDFTDDPNDWGYIRALEEVRPLAVAYIQHRQEADAHVRELEDLREANQNLLRAAWKRQEELEEENTRLRADLACGHRFHVGPFELYQAHSEEHTDAWTLVSKTKGERVEGGIRAALARARQLKEEKA